MAELSDAPAALRDGGFDYLTPGRRGPASRPGDGEAAQECNLAYAFLPSPGIWS